jgi:hypothetical protein
MSSFVPGAAAEGAVDDDDDRDRARADDGRPCAIVVGALFIMLVMRTMRAQMPMPPTIIIIIITTTTMMMMTIVVKRTARSRYRSVIKRPAGREKTEARGPKGDYPPGWVMGVSGIRQV